jgi:protein-disulfide isomerase
MASSTRGPDKLRKRSTTEKQRLRAERAAAALKEKQRQERRRQLLTVAGVLAVIALLVGGGFVINSMRDTSKDVAAASTTLGSQYGLTIGASSAPHKVVVYEDFLCPICGEFEKTGHEQLEQLADQGKVQIEYRPFVLLSRLGPYSARSTMIWGLVLQQDGDDVALKFHDLLYANQPSEEGPFPSKDDLVTLAGQAGADVDKLNAALDADDGIDWTVAATKEVEKLGVNSTPTVVLDGKPFTDGRTPADLATNLVKAVQ